MSSDATPRMHLAVLPPTPAQPQVTHNEALHQIDALTDICLLGQFVNTPPVSPADGDTYLLGGAPTGAWSGQAWKLAYCLDGGWRFFAPFNGLRATVAATRSLLVYLGSSWVDASTLVMPRLPSFHAYKTTLSSDVTGDGTDYPVVFDMVDWDTGGNYGGGTGIFTAPATGKYFFPPPCCSWVCCPRIPAAICASRRVREFRGCAWKSIPRGTWQRAKVRCREAAPSS